MTDDLTNKGPQDRSHINMHEDYEAKYWTHHLGVSREELQRAIDKVGNSRLHQCGRNWGSSLRR